MPLYKRKYIRYSSKERKRMFIRNRLLRTNQFRLYYIHHINDFKFTVFRNTSEFVEKLKLLGIKQIVNNRNIR